MYHSELGRISLCPSDRIARVIRCARAYPFAVHIKDCYGRIRRGTMPRLQDIPDEYGSWVSFVGYRPKTEGVSPTRVFRFERVDAAKRFSDAYKEDPETQEAGRQRQRAGEKAIQGARGPRQAR